MKISMIVEFQILERRNKKYVPVTKNDISNLSIGGFTFEIGDNAVPFDWDASSGSEEDGVFHFETGYGPFFNDFELPDYFDDDYEEMGIKREEISAEFLASVHHIQEFFLGFDDENGDECTSGWYSDNAKDNFYKVKLLSMSFEDIETAKHYHVPNEVLDRYNKGE
jgi:hypothetical protein